MERMTVTMLGKFSVALDGKPVEFDKNHTTKSMQLLEILLYYGEEGVSRKWLLENLYARENVSNPANNLRVTAHRLRKMLSDANLPDQEYIKISGNKYYFRAPFDITVDVQEFEKYIKDAKAAKSEDERVSLQLKACKLYGGDFMPALVGEDWTVVESVRLQEIYFDTVRELCEYYKRIHDYESIIALCDGAIKIYPLEEWYIEKIDCLIALQAYRDAIEVYEKAADRFFEEFGVAPSDKMVARFRELNSKVKNVSSTLTMIKQKLSEQKLENGALYCNYPSFVDNYRMIRRIIVRSGQSVYLMLCSIVETDGTPMENPKKLQAMAAKLKESITKSLRLGDVVTRYSSNQFIVLLLDTDKESCTIVSNRILKKFTDEHKSWRNYVNFNEISIMDVEDDNSKQPIKFNSLPWK